MSPLEFWEITPYELSLKIEAYSKKRLEETKEQITIAYLNSLWTIQWLGKRHKHPRPLKEILDSIGKEKREMTDEEMFERVKALNALFGGEVKISGEKQLHS